MTNIWQKLPKEKKTYENPLFSNCIVWLFDTGNFDSGLRYGFRAIELGQPTPDRIKRNWPTFIADEVFDWAKDEAEQGNSIEPYFGDVFAKVAKQWKLHEKVTAKFYKLAGLQLLRDPVGEVKASAIGSVDTLQQADELLEKAHGFHQAIGVRTIRKQNCYALECARQNKEVATGTTPNPPVRWASVLTSDC